MHICEQCKNMEAIALAPSGSRTHFHVKEDDVVCFSCLGLLQHFVSERFVSLLCDHISKAKFQHKYLRSSMVLPSCMYIRQHLVVKDIMGNDSLANLDLRVCLSKRISYLKAAWRELVVPHIEKKLAIAHLDGDGSDNSTPFFDVLLNFDYAFNDLECAPLRNYLPKRLQQVKPRKRPVQELYPTFDLNLDSIKSSQFTLLSVLDAMCRIPPGELLTYFKEAEEAISNSDPIFMNLSGKPVFTSQPVYVCGKYRKLSRDLPQSTWTADDGNDKNFPNNDNEEFYSCSKYKSSVEQLIGEPLRDYTHCDEYRFIGAGREDVDVRMLGSGRPFAIKLINPRIPVVLPEGLMVEIKEKCLGKLDLLDLEETMSRYPVDMLKQAETQKEKEYTAVCFIRKTDIKFPGIQEICDKINSVSCPLALKQRTPIRVMHRRSSIIRIRNVLKMEAFPFSNTSHEFAFVLRLKAEAGTYIKEFVHGDLNRTIPNIGTLISESFLEPNLRERDFCCEVDIVTLDVTNITEFKV